MRRVVITGVGVVTALGAGIEPLWTALADGRSGVGLIRGWDARWLPTRLAAEIEARHLDGLRPDRRSARLMTREDELAVVGSTLALEDAKLVLRQLDANRVGLFVGSGKDGCKPERLEDAVRASIGADGSPDIERFHVLAPRLGHPLFYAEGFPASPLFFLSAKLGVTGANTYYSGTAEAGIMAMAAAYQAIRRGEADAAVAGGCDAPVAPYRMAGWQGMGMMSQSNELGGAAVRPYDRDRDGTVLGEGSAFVVLEEEQAAQQRGAHIYAEIAGVGRTNDSSGLTPDPEGRSLAAAIDSALRQAEVTPGSWCYFATHGSGTLKGDASEARALRSLFDGPDRRVWASSVKSAAGHLMAGAGALNLVVAAVALDRATLPPTVNLRNVDPECEMTWVRDEPLALRAEAAVAIGRGMWGQSVAVALRPARS